MNKNKEFQIVVVLVVWTLVLLSAKLAKAETVYNFFFNPEQNTNIQKPGKQKLDKIEKIENDKPELVDSKSEIKSFLQEIFQIDALRPVLKPENFKLTANFMESVNKSKYKTTVGYEYYGRWDETYHYDSNKFNYDSAIVTGLHFYPLKSFGLFTELNIGLEGRSQKLSVAMGGELLTFSWYPKAQYINWLVKNISFSLLTGYSSYESKPLRKKYVNVHGKLDVPGKVYGKTKMRGFMGTSIIIKHNDHFATDVSIRKSFDKHLYAGYAGLSYNF